MKRHGYIEKDSTSIPDVQEKHTFHTFGTTSELLNAIDVGLQNFAKKYHSVSLAEPCASSASCSTGV